MCSFPIERGLIHEVHSRAVVRMGTRVSGISRDSLVALSLSVVAEAAMTMAPETPVAVNVTTSPNYMEPVHHVQFDPALAAVIMAMIICFFIVGFASGCLKRCIRPAEADPEDFVQRRSGSRTRTPTSKSQCGLDPDILEALPRVQYKDLPADEQVRKYFDCPVCLTAFDANDNLRLLPVCTHAFHSECIDVWFRSHSTCPLCRACLALPLDKTSREERGGNAEDGEHAEIRVREGYGVVEVVIGGDTEQDRSGSTTIPGFLQDRTRGAPKANFFTAEEEERVNAHPFLRSNAVGHFKPAVRFGIAPEKAAALAAIRRSNSVGTDLRLLHPTYVVDSEGTQHNRNDRTHAIDVEFLLEDHNRAQVQSSESPSRPPVIPGQHQHQHQLRIALETGASSVISRLGPQVVQSTRWSIPNLRRFAPA